MITLGRLNGFSASELAKFLEAFELSKEVMATLSFEYALTHAKFHDWTLLGSKVYRKLLDLDQSVDFSIETPVWYKRWLTHEIAREVTGVGVILNRDQFEKMSAPSLAGCIAHEYAHACGFSHSYWDTPERNKSVPYVAGRIVMELAHSMPIRNRVSDHLAAIKETNS